MDRVLFLCLITILEGGLLLEKADSAKISCKTCKEFVKSFHERLEATANSNYAGGDTSWEEENLGSYSNSEVRLVEMLDAICSKSDYNCHRLLEEAEEDIERWWLKWRKQDGKGDLDSWLCFTHLDVCCPENTFGPSCQDCPGSPNNTCGGRGRCEGSGEKDGKGTCKCDTGYAGDLCQSCDSKYFQEKDAEGDKEDKESGDLVCKECDRSCDKSCDGPGPGDCDSCAEGYKASEDGVCEDVDECKIDGDTRCKEGDYCLNNPGSFSCLDCDKACKKICNGPGPSKCAECAVGYTRNEQGVCQDDDECSSGGAKCSEGTYCDNSPGSYVCKACHVACLSGCYGPGGKGCIACKEGYSMNEDDGCKDIDECEVEPSPCDSEKEVCSNLVGTYVCKCKEGLVKGEDGKCVTEEERDRQVGERTMKNQKKKKKKKKKSKKGKVEGDVGEEEMRQHYSWYYALAPLTSSYLVYKYWKPNLVTSMGIILFICVSSTLSPDALSRM